MALDPGVISMVLQQLNGANNGGEQAVTPPGQTPNQPGLGTKVMNTATGAASGAAMGSILGPVGTGIGGVLGGIASLFK